MVQGQVFLKGGDWHFSIFKSLHLEIILSFAKLCYVFEEKFFRHHNFMKKGLSKLPKSDPENIP